MTSALGRFRLRGIALISCVGLAGSFLLGSCARPQGPPGGPRDFIPPMVVSTWPDTFETIEATRDPVVIRFSERISERPTQGALSGAVLISPATGEVEVKSTRSGLEVSVIGGFQPGLVYRVRVLPSIKDLFNNAMEGPFELVFSTGGSFETNVIAGVVTDLITGEPVDGVRVEAREVGEEDPPVYMTTSDSAGIYLLRYVPSGTFDISLFQDVNRNREPDYRELQGSTQGELLPDPTQADTLIQELALLRPDTTPAILVRAEVVDSVLVEFVFDDFLPTGSSLEETEVTFALDEAPGPAVQQLLWEHELDSIRAFEDSVAAAETARVVRDSLLVVADSLQGVLAAYQAAGDSVAIDSLTIVLEGVEARLQPPEPRELPPGFQPPPTPPILPLQNFFALLADSLSPDVLYQVTVTGVENINGVGSGGGESGITWDPPEALDTAVVQDTAGVLPDTAGVPPDTTGVVPPDTTGVPPDTTGVVPPDTIGVPPDTTGVVPPDTTGVVPPDTSLFSFSSAVWLRDWAQPSLRRLPGFRHE